MAKENPKFKGVMVDFLNNPIEGTEFIGWHSRSCAVTVVIYNPITNTYLLEKRGPGCPDNIGKLCFPCGYLGWDETLKEAAVREVYEEIGVKINPDKLEFVGIQDSPNANRQNVTIRYKYRMSMSEMNEIVEKQELDSQSRGGERNEVEEIVLVQLKDIYEDVYKPEDFAFNHYDLIVHS